MISNLDPANFLQVYNDVKAQDPNHIVYSSGWRLGNIGDYVDRVYALGMQPYHIPQLRTWMSCPGPSMAFSFHMIHETIKEAQIRGINNLSTL